MTIEVVILIRSGQPFGVFFFTQLHDVVDKFPNVHLFRTERVSKHGLVKKSSDSL